MIAYESDLGTVSLPLALLYIGGRGATGILTVQGENDIVAISFLDGRIVSADALNQTVEEGLGKILVAEGLIDKTGFEALAVEHRGAGGTLSELLIERRLITREQLLDALRLQTYRLMLHLLGWTEGEFKFYGGDEVSYEEGFRPIPVEELLTRALEEPELGGRPGAVPDPDAVYRAQPAAQIVRILGKDGDGNRHGLWLTDDEARLWQSSDGRRPAVAVLPAADHFRLQHALHRLLEFGLLEPVAHTGVVSQQVGAAEIFTPPAPAVGPAGPAAAPATLSVERPERAAARWRSWLGYGLAALACAALALPQSTSLLWPFPWQQDQRLAFERQLRQSLFQRIDASARVFYLMEGRFPENLVEMVDLGLLSARELRDPSGRVLAYRGEEDRYMLTLQGEDETAFDARVTEVASGDFLLAFARQNRDDSGEAPLYLLD